jgi:predicted peptidase
VIKLHPWLASLNSFRTITVFGLICIAVGCGGKGGTVATSTEYFPQKTGFTERKITVDGQERTVWVFIPPDYHPNKLYPTVLFLHGLFEKGNGGTNVLGAGLGPVIARNPEGWPFITIFPQSDGDWQGEARDRLAIAALDDAQRHYAIDPDRVILAGLSYGGLGVWQIGSQHKDRFAALVPVSGFAAPERVEGLIYMPVWAIVTRDDPFVNSQNSRDMCSAIKARGGRAHLTELIGDDHDCWARAVEETQVINWMLAQKRNPLQAASLQALDSGSRTQGGRLRAWND